MKSPHAELFPHVRRYLVHVVLAVKTGKDSCLEERYITTSALPPKRTSKWIPTRVWSSRVRTIVQKPSDRRSRCIEPTWQVSFSTIALCYWYYAVTNGCQYLSGQCSLPCVGDVRRRKAKSVVARASVYVHNKLVAVS